MRTTSTDRLMNEWILSGGVPMTRAECYLQLSERGVTGRFGADWFAFGPHAKTIDIATLDPVAVDALRAAVGLHAS